MLRIGAKRGCKAFSYDKRFKAFQTFYNTLLQYLETPLALHET